MANWYARNNTRLGGGWQAANNANQPIYGPQATIGVIDGGGSVAGVGDVQLASVTATLFAEDGTTPLADGINVMAVLASSFGGASPVVVGNAVTAGGTGTVYLELTNNADIMLIPNPIDASLPAGTTAPKQTGVLGPITPTVV